MPASKFQLPVTIKKPSDCSEQELIAFKKLVLEGGQVSPNGLENRIKDCKFLGFVYSDDNNLIGVSAIKQKSHVAVRNIKKKANADNDKTPLLELGYSFTKNEYRRQGINERINDELLSHVPDENIYATTDNNTMRKYLTNKGFIKIGNSFEGDYNDNLDYFER